MAGCEKSDESGKPGISWSDAVLFLLISIWVLCGIGSYGLYEPHEAQYATGATEMVGRGDWVTPYLNGGPELNKPPLFYWLLAISFKLLRNSGLPLEFVARLPLALISLGGILVAWRWARELWGSSAGRRAACMLAVSLGWYIFAHQLMIDELLSVLIVSSLYLLWKALCKPASIARWAAFYGAIGLAVLAKGLPGLFFPYATLGLFIVLRRDWRLIWGSRPILGIVIISAIVGPWAYVFEARNPGALYYIIVNEHFKRVFDTRMPHDYGIVQVSAVQFFMLTLLWCTPWSLMLPQVASFSYRNFRLARPVNSGTDAAGQDASANAILLLGIGAVLPVAFFALIPSRLIYYGLPAVPPFIVLSAGCWSSARDWANGRKRAIAIGALAMAGLIFIAAIPFVPSWTQSVPEIASGPMTPGDVQTIVNFLGWGLLMCGLWMLFRRERLVFMTIILVIGAIEVFDIGEFTAFDSIYSSKRLVEKLSPAIGDDCIWISEGSLEVGASAGLSFYLRQHTSDKLANVLIMGDDTRRPPPCYPGPPLKYLIDHKQLDEIWASERPVFFITDFQRTDWEGDPPVLPAKDCRHVPLSVGGNRHVYVNKYAWKRLAAAGLIPPGESVKSASENTKYSR